MTLAAKEISVLDSDFHTRFVMPGCDENENVNWFDDWLTISLSRVQTQRFHAGLKIVWTQTRQN